MNSDNPRPRVLVCDPISEAGVRMLREHADVDVQTSLAPEELLNIVAGYEALVVRSATQVTAGVIARAMRLKVIGRAGAGLDNIDVVAAQERGIQVVNSPDANTIAVAEHTLGLMLAIARRLPRADHSLKEGKWEKKQLLGTGLAGKTLGIVGFGRIGRQVAIRAQAFGMKVLVNQRRRTPELNLEADVKAVDLLELLQVADFVTLHVPMREETRNLIAAAQLARMKPSAFLINTARGGVVNEADLLQALEAGTIAGAALDVFETEPAQDSPLVRHPRVIATPHIGASTEDAQLAAAVTVAGQIIDLLEEVQVETVLPLRVVELARIRPHENVDRQRARRLSRRLAQDGRLRNPPVVMEAGDHYVVLDGATRTTALQELGLPHAVVQVVSPDTGLGLRTWFHVIRELPAADLLSLVEGLGVVTMLAVEPERAADALFEYGGLCTFHLVDGRVFLLQAAAGVKHIDALNRLAEAYIEASHVSRTLEDNLISLQLQYPDMIALVVFPEYTVSEVMQLTQAGGQLPAGITRFLIPGRILRLNTDLALLGADTSLREKNRQLNELLLAKTAQNQIRYYAEPVYLLDE